MSQGEPTSSSVYFYLPNKGAAIFFASAFAASGLLHVWQCWSYKFWKAAAFFPLCCALFAAGFAARGYGAFHFDDAQVYTASELLMYMSPPVLALANSIILARIFFFVPYYAAMHPSRMLATFASLTGVIELLTIAGVAFLANHDLPDKTLNIGGTLAKASLVVELLAIVLFFLLAGMFHRCCRAGRIKHRSVIRPLLVSYASMLLLLARTIFRTVEHFTGPSLRKHDETVDHPGDIGVIVRYEWYFYAFDAATMLVAVVVWNVWHPGRFLPRDRRKYLAQDGLTVLDGPNWKDSRSLTETFFNPFAMLTTRGGHQKQFWEHNGYALGNARRGPGRARS